MARLKRRLAGKDGLCCCCSGLPSQLLTLCACRLAACAEILRTHILPKLRLQDVQTLRQACTALRQVVADADAQLLQLTLVRTLPVRLHCVPVSCSHCCQVQALMPAKHLASQGTSSLQQLDALAALHDRIKLGQPEAATVLHVQTSDLGEDCRSLEHWTSLLSPTGACALVFWNSSHQQLHATVAGLGPEGVTWRYPCTPPASSQTLLAAWTPNGSHCAVLTAPLGRATAPAQIHVSSFDAARHCWLPNVSIMDAKAEKAYEVDVMCVSADGKLAAALLTYHALLVWEVCGPSGLCVSAEDAYEWHWAGSHAIVLVRQASVAVLRLDPFPQGPVTLCWVRMLGGCPIVGTAPDGYSLCWVRMLGGCPIVGIAPDGYSLWAVCQVRAAMIKLEAYSISDLACQGTYVMPALAHFALPGSVHASRQAVAVCCGEGSGQCTVVYQRHGRSALSRQMFVASGLGDVQFSACGRWLAGSASGGRVKVLDARTGRTLCSLQPADFWPAYEPSLIPQESRAAWSICQPDQLLISSCLAGHMGKQSLLLVVLRF